MVRWNNFAFFICSIKINIWVFICSLKIKLGEKIYFIFLLKEALTIALALNDRKKKKKKT